MALTVTYTFAPGAVIYASRFNTNFTDIQNWANAHETDNSDIHGITGNFLDTGSNQSVSGQKTFDATKLRVSGAGAGVASLQNASTSTNRTITIPDPGADDTLTALTATQTLTNKKLILPVIANQQWGEVQAAPAGTVVDPSRMGLFNAMNLGTLGGSYSFTQSNDGIYYITKANSGSGVTDSYHVQTGTSARLNHKPYFLCKIQFVATTNTRIFIGLANGTFTTNPSDTPTDCIGLQFSTARGDANFQFYSSDGASNTVTDSTIPVTTNAVYFEMDATTSSSVTFRLYDSTFTLLSEKIKSVNLPSATTNLGLRACIRDLASGDRELRHFFYRMQLRS